MITPNSIPIVHRRWDGSVVASTAGGYALTSGWKSASGQAATSQGCVIPGVAHAGAMGMFFGDPSLDSSFTSIFAQHLTPSGKVVEKGIRIRYPRYVYVNVVGDGSTANALTAAYPALAAGNISMIVASASQRPHAMVIPVTTSGSAAYFRDPIYAAEPDDYQAGDLFVANLDESWLNLNGLDQDIVAAYAGTISGAYSYTGVDPDPPVNTLSGTYTILETAKVTTGGPTFNVSRNSIAASSAMASRDVATAQIEWNKYRRFQTKLYIKTDPIPKVVEPGNFTTTRADLAALVCPAPTTFSSYSSAADVAAQIIADALAFFS